MFVSFTFLVVAQKKPPSSTDLFNSPDPVASLRRSLSPAVPKLHQQPQPQQQLQQQGIVAALSKSLEDVAGGTERGFRAGSVDSNLGLGFGKKTSLSPTLESGGTRNRLSFKLMRQVKVCIQKCPPFC